MNMMKKFLMVIITVAVSIAIFTGCGQTNTVEGMVVTSEAFTEKKDIEEASQPKEIQAGQNLYASVYFIESPKGMEYTGKWYVNGEEVKTDIKKTETDMCGYIVYELEKDAIKAGTLKFEVVYRDQVISSRELTVK